MKFESSAPGDASGSVGITTNGHEVEQIGVIANSRASYGIFAPAITRSRFRNLYIVGARNVGVHLGYGWENLVETSHFHGNLHAAVRLEDAVNAVHILRNNLESGGGVGILVNGGVAVTIEGNTIESKAQGRARHRRQRRLRPLGAFQLL